MRFPYEIQNSRVFGIGDQEVMQRHALKGEDEGKLCKSCVTSMHDIKSIRLFNDDVT
jgi:hypothetical protein